MAVGGDLAVEPPKSPVKVVECDILDNWFFHTHVLLVLCSAVEKLCIPHGRCKFEVFEGTTA